MTNENETKDMSEIVLWETDGIPWTVDDEMNRATGTPHYSVVVDEMESWANEAQVAGVDTEDWDDLVPIGVLIYAVEQLGKALEKSIVEANNLRSKLKALNEMNKTLREAQA
tara:strand:- start:550 stop:885 length:336 start_codon:yes stop_codon:yes gene_type:complete